MSETPTQDLVDDLQRSVRRWKALALTLLAGLGLVFVLGIGTAALLTLRARQQAAAAERAAIEARDQAHRALQERDIRRVEKEAADK